MTTLQVRSELKQSVVGVVETVYYQVVHWNPERFRIRIPRLSWDEEYATKLENLITSLEFVQSVRINASAKSLVVNYKAHPHSIGIVQEKIFGCIEDAGNPEVVAEAPVAEPESMFSLWMERLGLPLLGFVVSGLAVIGVPIPPVVIGAIIIASSIPVFQRAIQGITEEKELTIDFLDALAISLHTAEGRFFAPSFMVNLIESGEVIRDMTARQTERASLDLLDCLGKYAWVVRDGKEEQILLKDVVVGDIVNVYPGDTIGVDGCVIKGTGLIDQCKLTGESIPVTRTDGQEVYASTHLLEGLLTVLVEKTGNNTRAGIVVNLMQSAPVHDTRMENYARMIGNRAVIPTLLIGGGVFAFTGDSARAIALITLDLGTGIRVSVPTTILSALTYAARNGIYIRSGRAIEVLAKIDTIVFDKTGTLTIGHAGVVGINTPSNSKFKPLEVLSLAASAEQGITHPVAEAIVRHAKKTGVDFVACEEWDYKVGLGIVAKINGVQILVGSHRFMVQEKIDLNIIEREFPDMTSQGHSLVYVAGDGELIGVILYSDPPRSESAEVISFLKRNRITPYMLSGDVTRVAKAVAQNLQIPPNNVFAEAFPERKVEVVKGFHDQGKNVAFVGDGINDSAALAYASVSVSFANATDIARETADIVLMDNDLRGLVHAIEIAKQAMDIVWQNTAIVAVPNVGALIVGVLFALDPVLAIVINNGSAILAELNGLRPLLGPGGTPFLPAATHHIEIEPEKLDHVQLAQSHQATAANSNGHKSGLEIVDDERKLVIVP